MQKGVIEMFNWIITLSIDKCPHGTYAISVNNDGIGTRLTSHKCCGRWDIVKEFSMTPEQAREAANVMLEFADEAQRKKEKHGS